MRKAYEETIMDFEIELSNCGLFDFKNIKYLEGQIEFYKQKLKDLDD